MAALHWMGWLAALWWWSLFSR